MFQLLLFWRRQDKAILYLAPARSRGPAAIMQCCPAQPSHNINSRVVVLVLGSRGSAGELSQWDLSSPPVASLFLLLFCQAHSIFQPLLLDFPSQESIDKTKYSVRLKNSSRSAFAHYEFLISIVYSKPKPKPNPRIGVMKNYHST